MMRMRGCIKLLIFLHLNYLIKGEDGEHWLVQTSSGPIEGAVISALKEQVYVFYGIPYAEPPVGELRFKPPQPVKPWTDVLRTNKRPLSCYQQLERASMFRIKYEGVGFKRPWSEDCLTLNIWVPKPKIEKAPVLVIFHPGVFEFGSNNFPDGGILAEQSHDVVVTMNYRLGPFGFLNLGVQDASGNMGLLDQQLALKWIHENIHNFGGEPEAVILCGAGNAGAASVGYHVLAHGSAEYFRTIVPFSGSPTCSWAFHDRDTSISDSKILSERLGCSKGTVEEDLECLRHVHPEDITDASKSYTGESLHFQPTVDGVFLTESPLDVLRSGQFKKTVSLSVTNWDEGSLMVSTLNADIVPKPEEGMGLNEFRKAVLRIVPGLTKAGLGLVEEFYLEKCHDNNPHEIWSAAIKVYSDVLINCCVNQFNDLFVHQNGGAVFRSVENIKKESTPSWVGSSHAISALYSFGHTYVDEGHSEAEKEIMDYFKDWIKDNTRKKASELEKELVPYHVKNKNYSYFDMTGVQYHSDYRGKECQLWNEIIPKFQQSKECGHD